MLGKVRTRIPRPVEKLIRRNAAAEKPNIPFGIMLILASQNTPLSAKPANSRISELLTQQFNPINYHTTKPC